MSINKLESNLKKLSQLTSNHNQGTTLLTDPRTEYLELVDSSTQIIESIVIKPYDINEAIKEYVLEHLRNYRIRPGFTTHNKKGNPIKLDQDPLMNFCITRYNVEGTVKKYGFNGFKNFIIQSQKPHVSYDKISVRYEIKWNTSKLTKLDIDVEIEVFDNIRYNPSGSQYGGEEVDTFDIIDLYIKYLN
jgi:hypothetical protein